MLLYQQVFFASRSDGASAAHPAGDGYRNVLAFHPTFQDDTRVIALSIPTLEAATYSASAWRAMRGVDVEFDARRMLDRVNARMIELRTFHMTFDKAIVDRAITLLAIAAAPPPRTRTRNARPDAPHSPV